MLVFVTISYMDVIKYYTTAGGSYVVARDNFGPRVAQIAAVALLIDYTVTVAVQVSAGSAALVTMVPSLGKFDLYITVLVVLILIYGNLRGLREAGSYFAFPTYFYVLMLSATILLGFYKKFAGTLHQVHLPLQKALVGGTLGHKGTGVLMGLAFVSLLRAYANGGSSLTGLEAISNGVASFRRPESRNARKTLITMSCILGFLLLAYPGVALRRPIALFILFAGYRHKFTDDFALVATVVDPFDSIRQYAYLQGGGLNERTVARPHVQTAFLGFTYTFGGRGRPQRDTGIEFNPGAAAISGP